MAAINDNTTRLSIFKVKALQLVWKLGTRTFHQPDV